MPSTGTSNGLQAVQSWASAAIKSLAMHIDATMIATYFKTMEAAMVQLVLDKVMLVSLNVNIWQGRKAVKPADLIAQGIDISLLPPTKLATLGSKRIVSPEAVNQFNVMKREASKICQQYGVKFGNSGYAVPADKIESLCFSLDNIKRRFEDSRAEFVKSYAGEIDDWVKKNPAEWETIIRGCADSEDHVARSLSFRFSILEIKQPTIASATNGLDEEVSSLYGQLCHEVRAAAKIAYETSYVGKLEVGRRALRPIQHIREKICGLAFLDVGLVDVVREIDDTLAGVDSLKEITGKHLNELCGLLGNRLCNLGKKMAVEVSAEEAMEDMLAEEIATSDDKAINWDF